MVTAVSLSEPSFGQSAFQNEPDLRVRQGLPAAAPVRIRVWYETSVIIRILKSYICFFSVITRFQDFPYKKTEYIHKNPEKVIY